MFKITLIVLILICTCCLTETQASTLDFIPQKTSALDNLINAPQVLRENLSFLYKVFRVKLDQWFNRKKIELKQELEKQIDQTVDQAAEKIKEDAKNKLQEGTRQGSGLLEQLWQKIF